MKVLLDTHFLVWLMNAPEKISLRERAAIDAAESLHLSVISFWELRAKWRAYDRHGQRKGEVDPMIAVAYAERSGLPVLPLTAGDTAVKLNPPVPHKDLFDEMLLVHARRLGARLLTRDDKLSGHPQALQL